MARMRARNSAHKRQAAAHAGCREVSWNVAAVANTLPLMTQITLIFTDEIFDEGRKTTNVPYPRKLVASNKW